MNGERLFCQIDLLEEKFIKFLQNICNIESPTDFKDGLDQVGNFIADEVKNDGFEVEIIPQEKAGNLVKVTLNNGSSLKPIILSAHIDTVHPVGRFGSPAVRIENDIMYGPGVLDDKGGAAAALYAMAALKNCGYTERNVVFIAQTDEEVSSSLSEGATIDYITSQAKGCEAFINCESLHKGEAILKRKGIAKYRFQIKGKTAHAARCFLGANAVLEAAHKIIEIEKYKDKDSVTCNCSVISGGEVVNSVPDKCEFYVDVRYFSQEQFEKIDRELKKIAEKSYIGNTSCEAECLNKRPAMELTDRNLKFLEKINRIYRYCGMENLKAGTSLGGSDAANVSAAEVRVVDSLGCEGSNMHAANEFIYIRSLKEATKRIASIVYFYDNV